jgi:hypothetical protein
LPAAKNGTDVPLTGTVSVTLLENAPVVPLLNATAPPLATEIPVILTLTVGVLAPEGLLTRIRHGDGDHEMNRASGVMLLLICNSTFIVMPSKAGELSRIHRQPDAGGRSELGFPNSFELERYLRNNMT